MPSVILIVAGTAGSGKTTVGALLAGQLRWQFADADAFHPQANIEKMRAGEPLTDEDRMPWLRAVAAWIDERIAAGQSAVVACSALKRSYRNLLLDGRPAAIMVFLDVDHDILRKRLSARHGHFFPEKLLQSQLDTLEQPSPADEPNVRVVTADDPTETADAIIAVLWPCGMPGEPEGGAQARQLA
jgi:gluconokinase